MSSVTNSLKRHETPIDGLLRFNVPVHGDSRGWFKENWQQRKMEALGLPDFGPVQNNISFNEKLGVTRGLHAEPWDKWVSVATGRIFGAWVDLREGHGFGRTYTTEIGPDTAIYVPRGVANGFQTLAPGTAYTYLVNDHWSADAKYSFVNLADKSCAIAWPIPLADAEISDKDLGHPPLSDVDPILPRKILIIGAEGQLGRALKREFGERPNIEYASRLDFDLTAVNMESFRRWREYDVVINAAAYTAVDQAETSDQRHIAWAVNATGPGLLSRICRENHITLVHISSDYVYDGDLDRAYRETDSPSPVSVYGQSKAAGDIAVGVAPKHYIVRTSWVVGDGRNFVRTMADLAQRGVNPNVVADQTGRLTFTSDIAMGIRHLLEVDAPYGVYNLTNSGSPWTWAEVAERIFELLGGSSHQISPVTTSEYYRGSIDIRAKRPLNSVLDLSKLESVGYMPRAQEDALRTYLLG